MRIAAPEGRLTVDGTVYSILKYPSSLYDGSVYRMTISVETPAGSWMVFCPVPPSLRGQLIVGMRIEMRVTLDRVGDRNEPYFATGSRPKKARIIL